MALSCLVKVVRPEVGQILKEANLDVALLAVSKHSTLHYY